MNPSYLDRLRFVSLIPDLILWFFLTLCASGISRSKVCSHFLVYKLAKKFFKIFGKCLLNIVITFLDISISTLSIIKRKMNMSNSDISITFSIATLLILDRPPTEQTNAISALEIYEGYFAFLPSFCSSLTIKSPHPQASGVPLQSLRIRRLSPDPALFPGSEESPALLFVSSLFFSTLARLSDATHAFLPSLPSLFSFWFDHSGMLVWLRRGGDRLDAEDEVENNREERSAEKWAKWQRKTSVEMGFLFSKR